MYLFPEISSWTRCSDANLIKNIQTFWLHSSFFALEKWPENLNFQSLFTSNISDPLVAFFNEMRAPTSRKYVAEKGNDAKLIKTISNFLSHFSVFALEKPPKHLNFQSLFTTNIHFGGNFQWKACTYFQKICNWARYKDAKLIKNNSQFLVALLRFGFETRAPTSRNM